LAHSETQKIWPRRKTNARQRGRGKTRRTRKARRKRRKRREMTRHARRKRTISMRRPKRLARITKKRK
jgi:hypothetical protein